MSLITFIVILIINESGVHTEAYEIRLFQRIKRKKFDFFPNKQILGSQSIRFCIKNVTSQKKHDILKFPTAFQIFSNNLYFTQNLDNDFKFSQTFCQIY